MQNRSDFRIFLLIVLNVFGGFGSVYGADCWDTIVVNVDDNSLSKDYLKNVLRLLYDKDKVYTAKAGSDEFQLKVCGKLDGVDSKGGLVISKDSKKTVIADFGTVNATGFIGDKSKTSSITLNYKGSGNCKNSNRTTSASINVICSKDWTQAQFIRTFVIEDCTYGFILLTALCFDVEGKITATTSTPAATTTLAATSKSASSHMSPVTGFLLFVLAVAFGYCVIGFLYKRYVLGARGAQQIPNYLFWIRVSQAVQDCISNRTSGRYATSSSRTAEYDRANAADVQLMNDGEDMKYDQPPLVVGPGAGQTSTFRQQQLNVAPNTPAMNAQRHQQQQEPLLLPQDDADERLLQV